MTRSAFQISVHLIWKSTMAFLTGQPGFKWQLKWPAGLSRVTAFGRWSPSPREVWGRDAISSKHRWPMKHVSYFAQRSQLLFSPKTAGLKYRSRVQVFAPSINYQTTQIPLDLIEHFVKRLGLGDSFNAVPLSLSWWPVLWPVEEWPVF